ncbi:pyridoxine 5'-phosphate synthase [Rhodobacter aestuarii]|uniref:Pyridoxine 5'-phosphate synthase n=1 Tax=Rhodobacter aestuarii TaxID=453582 RepID=A0A1N7N4U3_9RHOB|nr:MULTISPECIES: pyridoxine 5'-phosphate synthase [Rhodobacter]PTV96236.1 pyridoxine 5'-phosphate synthase [Rhodobacter aestuarii]SIS93350.1 pyridoxine 5'-phosphate synthase [Rhodobacter aestuarii]SOB93477.1 pyridoxine 5'-phosphate synthase [Rhodobacter sp. JA431]
MTRSIRLGVNIDHVATLRNARGASYPSPLRAALLAQEAGADGITAHLREDRRHISDADMAELKANLRIPLNFEMAATEEMQRISVATKPHAVCLVPEKRQERTTEGGLDVIKDQARLTAYIAPLRQAGARVSMFIAPDPRQIEASAAIGAAVVELHTGHYCDLHYAGKFAERDAELAALRKGAALAASLGLEVHAGHGLTYETVMPIAEIPEIAELNIGHFLIAESVFIGLGPAIAEMRRLMDAARA